MLLHSDDAPCPTVREVWESYALPDLERRLDAVEEGKQLVEWNDEKGEFKFVKSDEPRKGKRFILELPLRAEVAIVHAYKADRAGNAIYHRTARNFNQIIATCADTVILEAEEIVEVGELDPDIIMTPGMLVDMIVQARKEDADA